MLNMKLSDVLPAWGKVFLCGIVLVGWSIALVVTAWRGFIANDFSAFTLCIAGSGFLMWVVDRILGA